MLKSHFQASQHWCIFLSKIQVTLLRYSQSLGDRTVLLGWGIISDYETKCWILIGLSQIRFCTLPLKKCASLNFNPDHYIITYQYLQLSPGIPQWKLMSIQTIQYLVVAVCCCCVTGLTFLFRTKLCTGVYRKNFIISINLQNKADIMSKQQIVVRPDNYILEISKDSS